jgi:hypothetical protein
MGGAQQVIGGAAASFQVLAQHRQFSWSRAMRLNAFASGALGLLAVALGLLVGTPFLILFAGPLIAVAGGAG